MNNETEQAPIPYPRLRTVTRLAVIVISLGVALLIAALLVITRPLVAPSEGDHDVRRVVVFTAQQVPVHRQWQGYGTVTAIDVADVPARVTATVVDLPDAMRAGRSVKKDELLMTLDADDYLRQAEISRQRIAEIEAQLAQWQIELDRLRTQAELDDADVALAQSELERVQRITEQLAGNQQQLDNARRAHLAARRMQTQTREQLQSMEPRRLAVEAQLEAERSALALAQLNVSRCEIRSPIAGILSEVDVHEGEQVQTGMRVARVVNLELVEAPLQLPAAARGTLQVGDTVTLSRGNNGLTCQATVTRISPVDDADTRTVTAYVEVDQQSLAERFGASAGRDLLLPGEFVSGVVTSNQAQPRWIVPRRSVRGQRIQVVSEGRLISRPVVVDFVIEGHQEPFNLPDTQWAVLLDQSEPLREGEQVLLDGAATLLDGQRVDPVQLPSPLGRGVGGEGRTGNDVSMDSTTTSWQPSPQPSPKGRGGENLPSPAPGNGRGGGMEP
ncbi:MAG: HlyD family efflux transporter periplasmic adaptor subunit [Phycisphaeraceae bacterium]|nr:HlyD family efflux transporter periplasmic adaptor subunit [Phycisphaeraceae bacterium]